ETKDVLRSEKTPGLLRRKPWFFLRRRRCTTQPRVAPAHPGRRNVTGSSTPKGLYRANSAPFVQPLRGRSWGQRSFPRVRWRDPGLRCETPSALSEGFLQSSCVAASPFFSPSPFFSRSPDGSRA